MNEFNLKEFLADRTTDPRAVEKVLSHTNKQDKPKSMPEFGEELAQILRITLTVEERNHLFACIMVYSDEYREKIKMIIAS